MFTHKTVALRVLQYIKNKLTKLGDAIAIQKKGSTIGLLDCKTARTVRNVRTAGITWHHLTRPLANSI